MKAIYVGVGILWSISLLAGRAMVPAVLASPIAATSAEITAQPPAVVGEVNSAPQMEDEGPADPRVDLLGNEIEDAMADYRFDIGGGIYERHSPETAVPRLGSPST
jgi:hypothetical protein